MELSARLSIAKYVTKKLTENTIWQKIRQFIPAISKLVTIGKIKKLIVKVKPRVSKHDQLTYQL